MKQISIDALNCKLFEAIEGLQNNTDPKASPNEKMDIDTAHRIAELGKVIVEGYKVKVQALKLIEGAEGIRNMSAALADSGVISETKSIG
jgi:hypothetical protein